jgi:predicted nucleic acid-binding protein
MAKKTKIILDADVIIHFAKGGALHLLPSIFPNYDYAILQTVYDEILKPTRIQLDNQLRFLKNIEKLPFDPKGEMLREYALLSFTLGKGESACMVYCRHHNDVIGSSNLKDIKGYCQKYKLTYLTTLDFLYYAIKHGIMTIAEANQFVKDVNSKDSKLPKVDFATFVSAVLI